MIVGGGGFKGMPDVDCVLVVRVKDDLGEVMMFVEDCARDGKSFIVENVVGLVLVGDAELVSQVEVGEPVSHATKTSICETKCRIRCILQGVPRYTLQKINAIGIANVVGEPQQFIPDGVVDADRCH